MAWSESKKGGADTRWLLLLLFSGLLIRLVAFDRSLWVDEAISLEMTTSWGQVLESSRPRVNPPLYYLLLRGARLLLTSPTALRLVSLPFGLLSLFFIWKAARLRGGTAVGLIALILAVFSPTHIRYSVELRPYAMLLGLSAASIYFFFRVLSGGSDRDRIAFAAATTLNIYTHYFAFLLYVPQALFLLLGCGGEPRARWRNLLTTVLPALLFLPWAGPAAGFAKGVVPGAEPPPGPPPHVLFVLTLSRVFIGFSGGKALSFVLTSIVLLVGIVRVRARPRLGGFVDAVLLLFPVALIAFLQPRKAIEPRHFLVLFPLWIALVAGGLEVLGRTAGQRLGTRGRRAALVAAALLPLALLLHPRERPPIWVRSDKWTDLCRVLSERVRAEDGLISAPEDYTVRKLLLPRAEPHIAEKLQESFRAGLDHARPFERIPERIERLWVIVVGKGPRSMQFWDALEPLASEQEDFRMVECDVSLFLLERPPL